jgi:RND family efflux transporter MFP subunit
MRGARVWTVLLVLCVALTSVVAARRHGRASEDAPDEAKLEAVPVETAPAVLGTMETTVLAQGTLAPAQGGSARVASAVSGRLLEVRVVEDQSVGAGQVVAVVDNRPQEYAAALALTAARSDRDHGVKQAQIALETARTELRNLQAGARPQEIAQAQQAVVQAKVTRDRAAAEATRTQYLLDHGIAAKKQKEDADTALAVADSALETARQQLSLLQAGARPEEVQAAKLAVSNAEQALALARESGDAHVQEAELALAQMRGGAAAGPVAGASTVLRAPLSGVVTHRFLNPGDMADPASPVLEIADSRRLDLVASLPEEEGMRVRAGMLARVRVGALTRESRVLSVGQVDPQTGLLPVRIPVDNADARLRSGAFAQAAIVVSTDPQAVLIPKSAVVNREGKTLVFVAGTDGKAHAREVALGAEEGTRVAVQRGVQPGERVIRAGQYALPDGAPITLAQGAPRP